jgi:hypothetical protein
VKLLVIVIVVAMLAAMMVRNRVWIEDRWYDLKTWWRSL